MKSPKRNLDPEDIAFIRTQMKSVKPLKKITKKKSPEENKYNYSPRRKIIPKEKIELIEFSDHWREPITSEAELLFSRPGLQQKIIRELKRGEIKVRARLDLHGKTIDEARTAVSEFISLAIEKKYRCLCIIHGKGKPGDFPILKNQVNTWLPQHPAILAFCSAQPKDGGTGAVYVLVKAILL